MQRRQQRHTPRRRGSGKIVDHLRWRRIGNIAAAAVTRMEPDAFGGFVFFFVGVALGVFCLKLLPRGVEELFRPAVHLVSFAEKGAEGDIRQRGSAGGNSRFEQTRGQKHKRVRWSVATADTLREEGATMPADHAVAVWVP